MIKMEKLNENVMRDALQSQKNHSLACQKRTPKMHFSDFKMKHETRCLEMFLVLIQKVWK